MMKRILLLLLPMMLIGCLNDELYQRPATDVGTSATDADVPPSDGEVANSCGRTFVYRHAGAMLPSTVRLVGISSWSPVRS